MFCPKLFALVPFIASLAGHAAAHAIIAGTEPAVNTFEREQAGDGSTTACEFIAPGVATASGSSVTLVARTFDEGADGGLEFTAGLSTRGANGPFAAVTVTTNGDPAPRSIGTAPIVVDLGSAGAGCGSGTCVLAFKTNGGFGNCVALAGADGTADPGEIDGSGVPDAQPTVIEATPVPDDGTSSPDDGEIVTVTATFVPAGSPAQAQDKEAAQDFSTIITVTATDETSAPVETDIVIITASPVPDRRPSKAQAAQDDSIIVTVTATDEPPAPVETDIVIITASPVPDRRPSKVQAAQDDSIIVTVTATDETPAPVETDIVIITASAVPDRRPSKAQAAQDESTVITVTDDATPAPVDTNIVIVTASPVPDVRRAVRPHARAWFFV